MNKMSLYALLFLCCFYYKAKAEQKEIPIIAIYGVPENGTDEDYRILSECGFNVNHRWHNSLEQLINSCRKADKHQIKILAYCPEMTKVPTKAATMLKNENGFWGYFINDEPTIHEISHGQKSILQLQRIDNSHCFYMNLFPYYYPDKLKDMLKTSSYTEYLHAASATSCQQISFDFYPILKDSIRHTWYHNLEMVRQESLSSGKPLWGFVCSVPHGDYPMPTLASLRLQVYSNLAYGAQAIQYYTYWTPEDGQGFHYHDAPIDRDGEKTKTYDIVQQMNRELKVIAKLFYEANITSVCHLGGIIPEGTTRLEKTPLNLSLLKIVGRQGAIISQFDKNGHSYMAIVNKSHQDKLTVRIKTKNDIPRHITKNLQEEKMKRSYDISAGDILLFRLK